MEAQVRAQLEHAAEAANQQQLVAIEKLYAALLSSTRRITEAVSLLIRAGWPNSSAQPPQPARKPRPAP